MTTIILCGGRGLRLKPLTDSIPKALVRLHNKPILQHILELQIRKKCRRFILCIGYQGQMIRNFISANFFDAEIEFDDLGENASMLERIYHIRERVGDRAFVTYGDTLINVDLGTMLKSHLSHSAAITLTTAEVKSPFGLITSDIENNLITFEEKPLQKFYIGHLLFEKKIFDEIDPELLKLPDGDGLVKLIQRLAVQKKVKTFPYNGPQITFNTKEELVNANIEIINFYTYQES
jgi:glucose-1-phosphate cytidylyltransferase